MAKQITYWLGAGASAQAVPTVNGLGNRMLDLKFFLEKEKINPIPLNEFKNRICEDIEWAIEELKNHQSIDTLAKKYFLTDKALYDKIKLILIIYFAFEQKIKFRNSYNDIDNHYPIELIDKRYDNLFASIINKKLDGELTVRNNIKIITWNYDLQIELALKRYILNKNIDEIKYEYQIYPNMFNEVFVENFSVVKLNGDALLGLNHIRTVDKPKDGIYDFEYSQNIKGLTSFLKKMDDLGIYSKASSIISKFRFGWEEEILSSGEKSAISYAIEIAKKTDVLIITGYSFPFFNSNIDKAVLWAMMPNEIIIEDFDGELIQQRLFSLYPHLIPGNSSLGVKFQLVKPGNYFYIHPETNSEK